LGPLAGPEPVIDSKIRALLDSLGLCCGERDDALPSLADVALEADHSDGARRSAREILDLGGGEGDRPFGPPNVSTKADEA
jgi:hypothetical protein